MTSEHQNEGGESRIGDPNGTDGVEPIFRRVKENPLLAVRDLPFKAAAVLNPGAAEQNGEVVLLLRVEDVEGFSSIHVARSRDGVNAWRVEREPLLRYGEERWSYEEYGCEDARVTFVPEEGCWYITYVAYSPMGPAVGIAKTRDFVRAERICLLGSTNDKDGVLFPRKFGGRWAILHRPDAGGGEHIWSAYSPDLIHWGEPHCVLRQGPGPTWDGVKVGAGPPPILTDRGWLLIFHGVKAYGGRLIYRAGAALLDAEMPHKVLARSKGAVFQAEAPYELSGMVPNVVFPTGAILRGDELWMYYGAADTCVGLATAKLADVMAVLS
ncbi:MAG TPA: glycosidase [Phycisphaerae bacterium]|nr:glycosidase [Phycisphaerae bacterium]